MRNPRTLVLSLFAFVSACDNKIDREKAEKDMREFYAKFGEVDKVTCPGDVKAKKDLDFECSIRFKDGGEFDISVHQTDDKGSVEYVIKGDDVFPAEDAAADIEATFKEEIPGLDADCGAGLKRLDGDGTYFCDVKVGTEKARVKVTREEDAFNYAIVD